jgi:hypothetical protein
VLRKLFWFAIAVSILGMLGLWLAYRATQQVPEFYREVLATPLTPPELRRTGDALEREILELHNDARREGRWEAIFAEPAINAWLAADLERKFPESLPPEVRDPRVRITAQNIQLACRYETEHWQTVVSVTADVYLTKVPNELAVRIREVHAGQLPLPLKKVVEEVSRQAARHGVPLRWSQEQADPVALVPLQFLDDEHPDRLIHLESLTLRDGEVVLQGRTTGK